MLRYVFSFLEQFIYLYFSSKFVILIYYSCKLIVVIINLLLPINNIIYHLLKIPTFIYTIKIIIEDVSSCHFQESSMTTCLSYRVFKF